MRNDITFIDLFAGIGGFRLGLENLRNKRGFINEKKSETANGNKRRADVHSKGSSKSFHCVWSNEWNKYCTEIYGKNFGEAPDTRDIRAVPSGEIPDHDLLCAGFPCPTFSIAGKGKGFEDTRGAVFFEIPRILRDKRPRHLLLENVKGLLSHQQGKTFQTILGVLADLGYRCEWQVLNSKDFGVPQNRERVFIVGHLGGEGGSQVFPVGEGDGISKEEHGEASSRNEVATALTKDHHKAPLNRGESYVTHDKRQAGNRIKMLAGGRLGTRVHSPEGLSPTVSTPSGGRHLPMVIDENIDGNLYMKDIVPTLRSPNTIWNKKLVVANAVDCDGYLRTGRRKRVDGKAVLTSIPERRIRRLTPIECERLQGFPDNWTEGVSDTQRYKMLGNAVTVNVVEAIGRRLREVLHAEG